MKQKDFFISYASDDKETAEQIAQTLKEHGYKVTLQKWDSVIGNSFMAWIREEMDNSVHFISIWSKKYARSKYCMAEFDAAHKRYIDRHNIFIIICADKFPVPTSASAIARFDWYRYNSSQRASALLQEIEGSVSAYKKRHKISLKVVWIILLILSALIYMLSKKQ